MMNTTKFTLALLSVSLFSGCSALKQRKIDNPTLTPLPTIQPKMVMARPIVAVPRQEVALPVSPPNMDVLLPPTPKSPPLPEEPPRVAKPQKVSSGNPVLAIQTANREALHRPDESGYENAMMNYEYQVGALYQVYTAPLRLTNIQLQAGEKVIGSPAAGDTVRWVLGVNESMDNGIPQTHILIKPTEPGLETTLVINTNRRTYLLELSSHPQTWMAAVRWHYPLDDARAALVAAKARQQEQARLAQAAKVARQITAPDIDLDNLNFAYAFQIQRQRPLWTPTHVFDDGRRVFIRFPKERQQQEAPALFVVSEQGDAQLVNYRVQGNYYIVDRLFTMAELRVGQDSFSAVRILRKG